MQLIPNCLLGSRDVFHQLLWFTQLAVRGALAKRSCLRVGHLRVGTGQRLGSGRLLARIRCARRTTVDLAHVRVASTLVLFQVFIVSCLLHTSVHVREDTVFA